MDISTAILFSFDEMVCTLIDRDRETERPRDRERQKETKTNFLRSQIAYQKVGVSFTS